MSKRSLVFSLTLLAGALLVQNPASAAEIRIPPGAQPPPQGEASIMRDCVVRNVAITNDGHTWSISVTNNCGDRAWACSFYATLKANDGTSSTVGCSGTVSRNARASQICSVTNKKKTWVSAVGNMYSCRY